MAAICCGLLCISFHTIPHAENACTRRNSVFLELGGQGVFTSINYERKVGDFGIRAGLMGFMLVTGIPVGINYLVGNRHALEIGIAGLCWNARSTSEPFEDLSITTNLGYRFTSNGGFLFRIGFTTISNVTHWRDRETRLFPWAGMSIGHSF